MLFHSLRGRRDWACQLFDPMRSVFFLNKGLIGQRGYIICIELNDNIEA